jgi:uncharacterized protein (TIRG00374 family)
MEERDHEVRAGARRGRPYLPGMGRNGRIVRDSQQGSIGLIIEQVSANRFEEDCGIQITTRRTAMVLLALVVVAGLFLFFGRMRGSHFRWDLFLATFRQLDPRWMAAAVVMIMFAYVGRVLRWRVMIRPLTAEPGFWRILVATVIGFTAVVLFGRAGELVRPYLIAVKERVSFPSQIATWLLERIYDLLAVLVVFGFALSQLKADEVQLGPALETTIRTGGYVVGALASVSIILLYLLGSHPDRTKARLQDALTVLPDRARERAFRLLDAFMGGTESTRSRRFVLQLLGYTAFEWLVVVGANYCVFRAFPLTAAFGVIENLIFVGFVSFGSIVQIPGIGGGMQVAAVLVLTELFGLSLEGATGVAVLLWIITYVVVIPIGLFLAFREGVSWRALRKIREEPVA